MDQTGRLHGGAGFAKPQMPARREEVMGNTLSYEGFRNVMISQMNKRFQEDSASMHVELNRAVKNNDTVREGLMLRTEGNSMTPCLYLEDLYALYEDGTGIDELINDVKLFFESTVEALYMPSCSEMTDFMNDWERVEPLVECKLVNSNANSRRLAGTPYRRMGEFAISYQIRVGDGSRGYYATQIKDEMLEIWGISRDELHETAMRNMKLPVNFVLESMADMAGTEDAKGMMFILTTKKHIYGATAIISDEVRQSVGKYMGGDYYILPSSIHELIVMPKKYGADLCALEQTVRDVNRGPYVPEEESLSDNVYEYDMSECKLLMSRNHVAVA